MGILSAKSNLYQAIEGALGRISIRRGQRHFDDHQKGEQFSGSLLPRVRSRAKPPEKRRTY